MENTLASILGFCGSITAASLYLPQVWISHRTKQTKQVAWTTIMVGMLNGFLWIGYGLLKSDPYIYVTYMILFASTLFLMFLKRKHG